jgi:hypothetical protein
MSEKGTQNSMEKEKGTKEEDFKSFAKTFSEKVLQQKVKEESK